MYKEFAAGIIKELEEFILGTRMAKFKDKEARKHMADAINTMVLKRATTADALLNKRIKEQPSVEIEQPIPVAVEKPPMEVAHPNDKKAGFSTVMTPGLSQKGDDVLQNISSERVKNMPGISRIVRNDK